MADTKFDVPIWHKTNLTVEEAAAYSGIGSQKLRDRRKFCVIDEI